MQPHPYTRPLAFVLAVIVLIALPYTRPIVFRILPLGTRPDDLLFVAVVLIGGIGFLAFVYVWPLIPSIFKKGK